MIIIYNTNIDKSENNKRLFDMNVWMKGVDNRREKDGK